MWKTVVVLIVVLVWGIAIRLSACVEQNLSGADQDAVLAFSEPITDNLFAGLTANDYARFSRDFDAYMQKTLSATDFPGWKQDLDSKIGTYLSRTVDHVRQSDEFYVVTYQAKFEKEESVIVDVAFHAAEPHFIANIWFNLDKLQKK